MARCQHAEWEPHHGFEMTRQLLADGTSVTALLCMNDRLAFGAYQALQEAGLRVPDDMSVASFDDDEVARYLRPGLTTARIPYEEMGRRALDSVLSPSPEQSTLVEMPLQLRDSVAGIAHPTEGGEGRL
jgi:LacI family transcriptional regulator